MKRINIFVGLILSCFFFVVFANCEEAKAIGGSGDVSNKIQITDERGNYSNSAQKESVPVDRWTSTVTWYGELYQKGENTFTIDIVCVRDVDGSTANFRKDGKAGYSSAHMDKTKDTSTGIPLKKNDVPTIAKHYKKTEAEVKEALKGYVATRKRARYDDGLLWDGKEYVLCIDLNNLFPPPGEEIDPPKPDPQPSQVSYKYDSTYSYKYCLVSLSHRIDGESYVPVNGLCAYNKKTSFRNYITKYVPNTGSYKALYENTTSLSNELVNDYSQFQSSQSEARYYLIKKETRRYYREQRDWYPKIVNVGTKKKPKWEDHGSYGSWYKVYDVSPSSQDFYNFCDLITRKSVDSYNINIKEPEYKMYDWLNLKSEKFGHEDSLTTHSDSKPSDFKLNSGYTNKGLNITLNSGKNKDVDFTILSNNKEKAFSLTFKDGSILGIPKTGIYLDNNTNGTYLVRSEFYSGVSRFKQSKPYMITMEPSSSTINKKFGELLTTVVKQYENTNTFTMKFAFRSIKFGEYGLGDCLGSNYWYNIIRLGVPNKLGMKHSTYAAGSLGTYSSWPSIGSNEGKPSLNRKMLNNRVDITASFIQPVLYGDVFVKDVAGRK